PDSGDGRCLDRNAPLKSPGAPCTCIAGSYGRVRAYAEPDEQLSIVSASTAWRRTPFRTNLLSPMTSSIADVTTDGGRASRPWNTGADAATELSMLMLRVSTGVVLALAYGINKI